MQKNNKEGFGAQSSECLVLQGLFVDTDKQAAVDDKQTIFVPGTKEPIITPIRNHSWFRESYFSDRLGAGGLPYLYYAGYDGLAPDSDPASLMGGHLKDAPGGSRLIIESNSSAASVSHREKLVAAFKKSGVMWENMLDTLSLGKRYPEHNYYRSRYMREGPPQKEITDLEAANARMLSLHGAKTCLKQVVGVSEIEQIWDIYQDAFTNVADVDPIDATLPKDDIVDLMNDTDTQKYITYDSVGVSAVCIIMAIRDCSWLNQEYVRNQDEDAYDGGTVFFCPGIFSRRGASGSPAEAVLTHMARVYDAADIDPIMYTECNQISSRYIPGKWRMATKRSGVSVVDPQVILRQSFSVVELG